MRKSVYTSYFHDLILEEGVRLFAEKGWECLELSTEHGQDLLLRGAPEKAAAEFLRFCGDLGVRLPQGHLKLHANIALPPGPARDAELDELRRWLDLFAGLGVQAAVLHVGAQVEGGSLSKEELLALNIAALSMLTAHAAGGPCIISLENGPSSAAPLLRLIEAVGADNMGICLDTGHLGLARARMPASAQGDYEFIVEAGGRLKALHIADNDGSRDQHLLPFEGGTVVWPAVMRGLRDVHYDGLFNFEISGETRCPLTERLEKLERANEIADRLLSLEV